MAGLTAFRSLVAAAAGTLSGCAMHPAFDASTSPSAQESYRTCEQGGAACVLKPAAMYVLDKNDPAIRYDFRSWILYDPRPSPGYRYIALMNEANDPVCAGYYLSLVINTTAPVSMTCFRPNTRGHGDLRFHVLQEEGLFAGKSAGTGIVDTDSETVFFVHGATPEETQKLSFRELWNRYGGRNQSEFAQSEAIRISSLPKLDIAPQAAASSGLDGLSAE